MLTGLLQPTRGVVQFDGHNIRDDLAAYRKRWATFRKSLISIRT